jgi:2-iminobutanoate/2-iminopropanoate deaminase
MQVQRKEMVEERGRSIEVEGVSHGSAPIPMAARVGPLLMSSAIIGKDPSLDKFPDTERAQIKFAFKNLLSVLENGGASLKNVVHLKITVGDNSFRGDVNVEWESIFKDPNDRPARHIVVNPMQHGMIIQLEVTAFVV